MTKRKGVKRVCPSCKNENVEVDELAGGVSIKCDKCKLFFTFDNAGRLVVCGGLEDKDEKKIPTC